MTTTTNPQPFSVNTGDTPVEGRMTVPFILDFSEAASIKIELTAITQMQNRISVVQTVFVDNSANESSVSFAMQNTGQVLIVPPNAQAYLPMVITNQVTIIAASAGGVLGPLQLLNFGVAPTVWSVVSGSGVTQQVADAILDATVVGGAVQTTVAGNKTYTSHSSTITAGGTAQTAAPAQAGRSAYRFCNLSTDILYINDVGGTAGPAVADSIAVPAGALYETQPGLVSPAAISVYGATTGDRFTLLTV